MSPWSLWWAFPCCWPRGFSLWPPFWATWARLGMIPSRPPFNLMKKGSHWDTVEERDKNTLTKNRAVLQSGEQQAQGWRDLESHTPCSQTALRIQDIYCTARMRWAFFPFTGHGWLGLGENGLHIIFFSSATLITNLWGVKDSGDFHANWGSLVNSGHCREFCPQFWVQPSTRETILPYSLAPRA